MSKYTGLEIAIIGMSGRFPDAVDIHSFWDNLKNGVESVSFFTNDELAAEGVESDMINDPSYVKANSYLRDKEYFDANFFGFRPEEAEIMDPQIRVFIESCWNAIEDAGYDLENHNAKIGIFAGGSNNINWETYTIIRNQENDVDDYTASQLRDINFLCSRVAYLLNLQGPAVYIDTACSTSLVAVQRACMSLLLRECSMALAGGVSINNFSKRGYLYREGMINSDDGHCRAFDAASSGTISGEGCGALVLKRLEDAINDRDHIYAIIKGSAVNNDGREKSSFTAPSVDGQYKTILKAFNMAKVEPESISYVEAHGTGTKLGDPIEVEALNLAFGKGMKKYCALGSVKSNIGHLNTAAGVAGLIKTILALKHKQIPASLNFQQPNPKIDFENGPFFVNSSLKEWERSSYPLRAGVSSFGIGGTNAHVILEEAPEPSPSSESRNYQLLVFSAKTPGALERNIENFTTFFHENKEKKLADVAFTLQSGRMAHAYRKIFVCQNHTDAFQMLSQHQTVKTASPVSDVINPSVVFMFSGQGSQYTNMCHDLYISEPIFKNLVDGCFEIMERISDKDFRAVLFSGTIEGGGAINETAFTQPLLFIVEYALARLVMHWGITPEVMIGHSIGEYVAACISGVFSLEDALTLIVKRGLLMQDVPKGLMLSIAITEPALSALLKEEALLSLAAVNSSELCVVSGEERSILAFKESIEEKGYKSKVIHTSHAFHSHMMDGILDAFEDELKKVKFKKQQIPFISNLSGRFADDKEIAQPAYWVDHLRQSVQFSKGIETLLEKKGRIFVEIGPGRALASFVQSHLLRTGNQVINLVRHMHEESNDLKRLLSGIGELWTLGVKPDWSRFYENEKRQRLPLPVYPFDKLKYTANVDAYKMIMDLKSADSSEKDPLTSNWFYAPSWKLSTTLTFALTENREQRTLIFADNSGISDALLEKYEKNGHEVICVRRAENYQEISPGLYTINPFEKEDYSLLFSRLSKQGLQPDQLVHCWGITEHPEEEFSDVLNDTCFYSLLEIVKACQAHGGILGKQVVAVTNDLHPVGRGGEIRYGKSLSVGFLKVLSQEYPTVCVSQIDITLSTKIDDVMINDLYEEMQIRETGKVVSLRHSCRWVQIFDRINLEKDISARHLKEGGVYLITGGLGGLGCNFSKFLLTSLSAKVILIGRSKLPVIPEGSDLDSVFDLEDEVKEKVKKLKELEEIGDILYFDCDVSNAADLSGVIEISEGKFGAINGVIHAAGIIEGSSINVISELVKEDFETQFYPKIKGLEALNQVLGNKTLDFCILTSSLSALLGGIGFGAYAAANVFMDYYIKAQRGMGRLDNWISVNLDGLNFNQNTSNEITPVELFEVFERVLTLRDLPQIVVSVSDLDRRLRKWVNREEEYKIEIPLHELSHALNETGNNLNISTDPIENALTVLWQNFFGRADIGLDDDFFGIGGDSLKALTMIGRIHKSLNVEVSIKEFFGRSSIRLQSEYIRLFQNVINEPGFLQKGIYAAIPRSADKGFYSLSSIQKRIYFLYEVDKSSLAYNLPQILRLEGSLNGKQLSVTFHKLLLRHESLRTYFELNDGEVVQKIAETVWLEVEHFSGDEDDVPLIIEKFIRPFNLNVAPLMRVGLIKTAPETHILMVDMHHIIADGVSFDLLIKDFMALYNNEELEVLGLQYKDFAEWQQSNHQQVELEKQKEFWKNEFSLDAPILEFPTDYPRPDIKNYEGSFFEFSIDAEETAKIKELSEAEGTTLYMMLLSIYNVLLRKICNQEDIVVGTPTSGRHHVDLENIIGMFVNTLPLRNYPKGNLSFKEFLSDVKNKALACFDHQLFQYESLIDELKIKRSISRNPLFDAAFSYENFKATELSIPDLTLKPYIYYQHNRSKFDISLVAKEKDGQFFLSFEYSTELFKDSTIESFAAYFKKIVSTVLNDINIRIADIEVIEGDEKNRILYEFNHNEVHYQFDKTVVDLFEEQVLMTPENVAIVYNEKRINYQELNSSSNQLAFYLKRKFEIKPNDLIGVMLNPSDSLIIAILAILKAGAAYVPIDPNYPDARVNVMIGNSELKGTITADIYEGRINSGNVVSLSKDAASILEESIENPEKIVGPDDLLYVIYTSGSTGIPKGVMVKQHSFTNLMDWYDKLLDLTERDRVLLMAPVGFDLAQKNIFAPLLKGAALCLSEKFHLNYIAIADAIQEHGLTVINVAPSAFYPLLETRTNNNYQKLSPLRKLVLGGEPIKVKELIKWSESEFYNARIINSYGPTECTDIVAHYEIGSQELLKIESIPIGKPIQNTQLYILDAHLNLLPIGVPGEIYIGGVGVSKGYLGNNLLTEQSFIKNPFKEGDFLYKTGDLGKWLADGNIDFLGRRDEQVKIRGFRIELGEIENNLAAHDKIIEAAVLVKEREGTKDKYMVAYYLSEAEIKVSDLRSFLLEKMPDYFIPDYYVHLLHFPLNPNGKLDKKALPEPKNTFRNEFIQPKNQTQRELVKIWGEVLGIEINEVGVNVNFFEIGGNSLKLVSMANKVNLHFGTDISVVNMFKFPEISLLAEFLDGTSKEKPEEMEARIENGLGLMNESVELFNRIKD